MVLHLGSWVYLDLGSWDPWMSHGILSYLSYGFWTAQRTHLELGVLWDPGVWDPLESGILDPGILSHGILSYATDVCPRCLLSPTCGSSGLLRAELPWRLAAYTLVP